MPQVPTDAVQTMLGGTYDEGEGELFYQQVLVKRRQMEALEALDRTEKEARQQKKVGSTERVEGSVAPQGIGARLLIAAFIAAVVACVATLCLNTEDQAKIHGIVYAVLSLGAVDACFASHTPARWYDATFIVHHRLCTLAIK